MIAIELGAEGPNYGVASACAAGSHAMGTALRHLQNGEADVMLTGGAAGCRGPSGLLGGHRPKRQLGPQAAATEAGAPPQQLGGSPGPPQLASGGAQSTCASDRQAAPRRR